jgi:SAM-dependent methyltransferase
MAATCRELREAFHRRGRISSRQEALDELSKLLFGHVMSATHGGPGIGRQLVRTPNGTAVSLREFVAQQFHTFVPVSLVAEMKASDFSLRLRGDEDDLAVDLITAFDSLREPHVLESIRGLESIDVLNDAFGQFIADSFVQEKELGQYLTPNEVVRFMVRLGMSSLPNNVSGALFDPNQVANAGLILDPSCGVGTFLTEALRVMYAECCKVRGAEAARTLVAKALEKNVIGIDKSERMLRLALTNLAMFGAAHVNLHLANSLARTGTDGELTESLTGRATLILTNPPFGAHFDGSHLLKYRLLTEWTSSRGRGVDSELLFLERYLDWLAPGGHLVAIVPDSVLTNRGVFEDLRRAMFQLAEIKSVVSLPAVTFGVAGTTTKTSVLHLTRRPTSDRTRCVVFFGVCDSVGYDIQTRGATRTKVPKGKDQLPSILEAREGRGTLPCARMGQLDWPDTRWDAVFHAGLSTAVRQRIESTNGAAVRVTNVAELVGERFNPARLGTDRSFQYIEISDVDGESYSVRAKEVQCSEAPSRARKRVRAGDVLVSTVRPERRTIGVVPPDLDGAICSTGFAVLRCREGVPPLVLASLLRHPFCTEQLVKQNSGIAYPAIEEDRVLDVTLPVERDRLNAMIPLARRFDEARLALREALTAFTDEVVDAVNGWVHQ